MLTNKKIERTGEVAQQWSAPGLSPQCQEKKKVLWLFLIQLIQ